MRWPVLGGALVLRGREESWPDGGDFSTRLVLCCMWLAGYTGTSFDTSQQTMHL